MIEFRKCYPEHIVLIEPTEEQLEHFTLAVANPAVLDTMCSQFAMSAWVGQRPVAACGVFEVWQGRGIAWNFMCPDAHAHALPLVRKMRWYLDRLPFRRIEMDCNVKFKEAATWARLLGFTVAQERAQNFYPDGTDAVLFERVR